MAKGLIVLYEFFKAHPDAEWVHIPTLFARSELWGESAVFFRGDFAKLRRFGMITSREELMRGQKSDGTRRIGMYRIEDVGCQFVERRLRVAKKFYEFCGKRVQIPCEETISIDDALGTQFDLQSVLHSRMSEDSRVFYQKYVEGKLETEGTIEKKAGPVLESVEDTQAPEDTGGEGRYEPPPRRAPRRRGRAVVVRLAAAVATTPLLWE